MKSTLIISFLLFHLANGFAQDSSKTSNVKVDVSINENEKSDSLISNDIGIIGYPYAFYSPETKLAIGAGGLIFFRTGPDKEIKPSKIILSGFYTTNKQYNFVLGTEIYFPGISNTFLGGKINFGKKVSNFYGIGNQTNEIAKPGYIMQMFSLAAEISSIGLLFGDLQSGVIYEYSQNRMLDKQDNPIFESDNVLGEEGGKVAGLGLSITFDKRDNIFYPSRGSFLKLQGIFYRKPFGSEFSFDKYILDYRQFWEPFTDHFIAFQIYSHLSLGNPPFFRLPALGGASRMRGFFEGRYRDKQYVVSQIEYRKIIWWRFGIDLFASVGDVADKITHFKIDELKSSYGFGIRFVFDENEKINMRVDFGFSKDDSGVYFAIEEAF